MSIRVLEQMTQHLTQVVCCVRRVRLGGDDAGDVLMFEASDRFLSMLGAKPFDNVATHRARARLQRRKYQLVIRYDQAIDAAGDGTISADVFCVCLYAIEGPRDCRMKSSDQGKPVR
jgi:hypothetical protein